MCRRAYDAQGRRVRCAGGGVYTDRAWRTACAWHTARSGSTSTGGVPDSLSCCCCCCCSCCLLHSLLSLLYNVIRFAEASIGDLVAVGTSLRHGARGFQGRRVGHMGGRGRIITRSMRHPHTDRVMMPFFGRNCGVYFRPIWSSSNTNSFLCYRKLCVVVLSYLCMVQYKRVKS